MTKVPKFNARLAIFDLDGTLIHFEHDFIFEKLLAYLPGHGYGHITRAELERLFSENRLFDFVPEKDRHSFGHVFFQGIDLSEVPKAQVLDGAPEVLAMLVERGLKVAIATARAEMREDFKDELRALGVLKHISIVSTRDPHDPHWRDKRGQLKAVCSEADIVPAHALMAGDMPEDIRAAHLAGLGHGIGLLSGGIRAEVLQAEKPHVILPSISSIPEYLSSLARR